MNVRVLPAGELGPAEIARWSELARATPLYRNPFFRPELTQAVARVRPVRVAVIEDAGAIAGFFPFEVGRRRAARPVGWPYSDYHGPVLDAAATIDARELVRACGVSAWSFDHLPAAIAAFDPHVRGRGASPYLDLSEGFEPYLDGRRSRSDIRGALRKGRKLAREVGPLRLVAHSDDPELLARTIDWKRAQYAETGVRDVLADTGARDLLGRVQAARGADFAGALSVLYAGDVVAALHLGLRSGRSGTRGSRPTTPTSTGTRPAWCSCSSSRRRRRRSGSARSTSARERRATSWRWRRGRWRSTRAPSGRDPCRR